MKKIAISIFLFCFGIGLASAQTNTHFTNPLLYQILKGNYNPAAYIPAFPVSAPDFIVQQVQNNISPDTLKDFLEHLQGFETRNTGSDTLSPTRGMGAARTWSYNKFLQFSARNQNRLQVGYLQFDQSICGMGRHKNVVAILPGADTTDISHVLIEAHLDSRCNSGCDVNCMAYGADDNGSGSVMVLELARILSYYVFDRTIVFMLTTGEEQGLHGATAYADYAFFEKLPVKAVLNNDVVGGTLCGTTASAPGCGPAGDIDSLNLRLYSFGGFNSEHKQLARYIKLQYKEMLRPKVEVPMALHIMTQEDRTGRGGDHIPFRQKARPAMRFTSANEHGNGNPVAGYIDHQHTSADSLGIDLDQNGTIDSFFVDFNYLARNSAINGTALAMIAAGPERPGLVVNAVPDGAEVIFTASQTYPAYRVAIRSNSNDWDSVFTVSQALDTVQLDSSGTYIFSGATVNTAGVESLFSFESLATVTVGRTSDRKAPRLELLQNSPNPADESTLLGVMVRGLPPSGEASIVVHNAQGGEEARIPLELTTGLNEVVFRHGFNRVGVFLYSLVIDGEVVGTKKMVMR